MKWTFTTIPEFDRAIPELRCTFAVFRRLGMKVSTDKTKAVLSITGPIKHKIHKLYVRKQARNDGFYFLQEIPHNGCNWWSRLST